MSEWFPLIGSVCCLVTGLIAGGIIGWVWGYHAADRRWR